MITRRGLGLLLSAAALGATPSRLSMQGYIWVNLANRAKKPLAGMLPELMPSAPKAGFESIELSDYFFTPELKVVTLEQVERNKLKMPSVYAGGAMHQKELIGPTIEKALVTARLCKPFGCAALIHNPNPKPKGAAKTDEELGIQAEGLNQMAKALAAEGYQLRVHHHNVEMENDAREWRHILKHTDAKLVTMCMDVEFVYRGGFDPVVLVREAGSRLTELHLRNRKQQTPLESFEPGDIDYAKVAGAVKALKLKPQVVVELAYHDDTSITRSFEENVRRSKAYAAKLFGL